ncbi:Lariat debranching enzyme [Ceratocystis platani]|uniref:Lariat debranching enzyme n=1 Tax=Ceratocystis fimbriata f. sp. platani TaxID=88771 RepID=A0A0F8AWH0_CERFI|nr:Lariat debranching enzyme [Ceratocystis platani]
MAEPAIKLLQSQGVRVAVEGCGHGTLNAIYESVKASCSKRCWDGIDLLIIGGDFQAVRNPRDLNAMSVPAKYRELGDFHEYYSGKRKAPYLTLFIAGNHEASNHLWELFYGGWAAPNIYYMGAANVLRLGPIRIAGLSGIWKGRDYQKTHFERLPFNSDDVKSFYHVREIDVRRLLLMRTQVDVGLSHDWPRGIEWNGNANQLFRFNGTGGSRFKLQYDPEWLAINRVFAKHIKVGDPAAENPPDLGEEAYIPLINAEKEWVQTEILRCTLLENQKLWRTFP